MSVLYFEGPEFAPGNLSGQPREILGCDASDIERLIDFGVDYWGENFGGAELFLVDKTEAEQGSFYPISDQLQISFHHRHGFQLQYVVDESEDDATHFLGTRVNTGPVEPVEMNCGGPFWFPSSSFCSADIAKEAVRKFSIEQVRPEIKGLVWQAYDDSSDPSMPDAWKKFV